MWGECAWGDMARLEAAFGGAEQARAHLKHIAHVADTGRVEAQHLVEDLRLLPRWWSKRRANRRVCRRETVYYRGTGPRPHEEHTRVKKDAGRGVSYARRERASCGSG